MLGFAAELALALLLGALIGVERQWRRRLAGLQTNALVALGAAGFVGFSQLVEGDSSPTRVAAQVVSGIGFLGAGVIFKDGFGVRGLNTAATIWCSAAVGVLCGIGAGAHAAALAGFVVAVNLLLRPVAGALLRRAEGAEPRPSGPEAYAVTVLCAAPEEARVRTLLLKLAGREGLRLQGLDSADTEGGRAEIAAELLTDASAGAEAALEGVVGALSLDPAVSVARWRRLLAGAEEG